jgi:hypothetical protein
MLEELLLGFLLGILSMAHIFPHSKSFWESLYDFINEVRRKA